MEGLPRLHRRHAELAGGDLLVLLLDGTDDILRRQRARVELVGVEPEAHRILAGAEDIDIADARHARQFILQMNRRVIGEIEGIVARIRANRA